MAVVGEDEAAAHVHEGLRVGRLVSELLEVCGSRRLRSQLEEDVPSRENPVEYSSAYIPCTARELGTVPSCPCATPPN